ncbi:hypothetical protein JOC37_001058 [Desulfohalotomaculum tongense]|uniref:Gmad2 immunoglobulin-like domain-containing protein n=1 Tax=Desulforadius tongensis TaxID=1216062 RepID=UPI0019576DB3|nr:Gmad2 immunoglobulin-like domain-containing protein [Desulforadius tongensis]MBM7854680.1 hypothetical protein [Desulforadius tongensis]
MGSKVKYLLQLLVIPALLVSACTGGKKPEQKPETLIVPEVSSIPFETIKLDEAPPVVKKMARAMSDQDYITWASVNGSGYVIIFPGANNQKTTVEIDKIEHRVPDRNHSWLNVKLKYSHRQRPDNGAEPIVAKFDLENSPNAMGFQLSGVGTMAQLNQEQVIEEGPVERKNEVNIKINKIENNEVENKDKRKEIIEGPAIRITQPAAAEAVTSPVTVTGVVALKYGNVGVRVKNSSGQVLAEKPVEVTKSSFETTVSFSPPAEQQQGFIEAFLIDPEDNTEISRVSVSVLLEPKQE